MTLTVDSVRTLTAAGALLTASVGERLLRYLVLPYGEQGRTSAGLLTINAGAVTLPADVGALTLNLEHDFTRPVGRAVDLTDTPAGIVATFHVAATSAGDDLLTEAAEGLRPGASVELADSVIRGGRLVSARLVAAGAVVRPAFPSALLVASDTPDPDTPGSDPTVTTDTDTDTDNSGDELEDDDTDDDGPPADEEPTGGNMTTDTVTASAPADLTTTAPRRPAPAAAGAPSMGQVAMLLAAYHDTRDPGILRTLLDPVVTPRVFAALTDIKYDGTGGLAPTIAQPQWLGELWSGVAFTRRIIPLFNHGDLSGLTINGWRWKTKPAVAPWTGNKAPVPSNPAEVEPYTTTARRLAGAWDIAREFRDFNVPGFWEGFFAAGAESYARQSDAGVLADVVGAATDVEAGTVPANVPVALSYIVDGALSFIDTAPATFAIVATDLWAALVKTPTDKSLEFLSVALSIEEGAAAGFPIVPASSLAPGTVLVGARNAATVHELPGSPIRVEAENIAQGGIDEGLFGYYGTVVHDAGALALVADTIPLAAAASRSGK
jgi:hypothetical protein